MMIGYVKIEIYQLDGVEVETEQFLEVAPHPEHDSMIVLKGKPLTATIALGFDELMRAIQAAKLIGES